MNDTTEPASTDASSVTVVATVAEDGEVTVTVAEGTTGDESEVGAEIEAASGETHGGGGPEEDLNPIFPELKEVAWGFGSFVVLALLMRYVLYPRLRKGMDARYQLIEGGHTDAARLTESAKSDVAAYEQQLVEVRAEAAARIDAARQTLEGERTQRLTEVNARIGEMRAAAQQQLDAARAAARGDVESAVGAVAAHAGRLVTGRDPDPAVVRDAVAASINAGASR